MHDEHGAFDEAEHVVGALMEARLGREELDGEPVHLVSGLRHVALGVEVAMPHPPRRDAVEQLDGADLDDAMARGRVEPRCFSVEHDFSHAEVP